MGRITIFSLDDCPHCKRTKIAFYDRTIPFVEINLTIYPQRRKDMMSLSDRLSVPQVFFNELHIGGADDTIQLLKEEWDSSQSGADTKYQTEIGSLPDPTDLRLRQPTPSDPKAMPKEPRPRDKADQILLPCSNEDCADGDRISIVELVETRLKPILSGTCKIRGFQSHKHCFTATQAVAALAKEFCISNEQARAFGSLLLQRQVIQPIESPSSNEKSRKKNSNDNRLNDNGNYSSKLYRLQCYHTPHILNSYRIWDTKSNNDDPMEVVNRLKKMLGDIESNVTNASGQVDYKQAALTKEFAVLEEAACELQKINMDSMDYETLVAFGINVYNLCIKFSFLKAGIYNNPLGLLTYFTAIMFNIGSKLFSFHDLESGILRGNRPPPYSPFAQIGKKDPRRTMILSEDKVDCRIHFGLNCGAKSCPPVNSFTAESIDEELRIVTVVFCEDNNNVMVDSKRRTLYLSQIISWYRVDFASSKKELPLTIVQYLRGDKKEELQAMINDGKGIRIKFKSYDWSTNASDFIPYRKSHLKADTTLITGLCW